MKCILVTTDFSPPSLHALEYVLELFKDTEVPVRILLLNTYLVHVKNGHQEILELNDELKLRSKKNLEHLRLNALERIKNPNITIETTSHMGSLPNVISNLIHKEKINIVAIAKDTGKYVAQIGELLKKHHCQLLITSEKDYSALN